jgi:long-subunit acyl-CoA synthetase (AMP-forming)
VKNVPGSAGILLPSVEARIVRDDGTDAGLNEPGELLLRSGAVALGYWNNEDASRETFVDGWLRTGDQFSVDKDGTFYFLDRIKVKIGLSFACYDLELLMNECIMVGHVESLRHASVPRRN